MQRLNDTNSFYDAIAQYYPMFYRDYTVQMEREGLGLRSVFRNRGVERVLDASCGAGAQAIPLATLGYRVTAADPSMGMLAKARSIAAKNNVSSDKLSFVQASFQTLMNHVKGPFDAIVTKGNSLPHLLEDSEIELAIATFHELLRPGGTLIIGMRDFGPFMQDRPRFIPGLNHQDDDDSEFITFDLWEWNDGPPVIATQNLYIVSGKDPDYTTLRRQVVYRPLSTDEVKVVLLEAGFEEVTDTPDRSERVLVAKRSASAKRSPLWAKHTER